MDKDKKLVVGIAAGLLIFMGVPFFLGKKISAGEGCVDCGCKDCVEKKRAEARITRGEEVYDSEMDQDVSGPTAELNRINPIEIGGAEDVYGAESYEASYVNMNPLDYQTPTAFSNYSGYASQPFWDQANDMLPEYRYTMPWTASYLPVNEWRPNDQQGWPAGPLSFDPRTRSGKYPIWRVVS